MYFREVIKVKSKCNGIDILHVAGKVEKPTVTILIK